jgi:O-antigen/teichoic acid export membrane protein
LPVLTVETLTQPPMPDVVPATEPIATSGAQGSVGQSILRGALALLSTQPLTWGVSLLGAAVIPRFLGADALGQYAIAQTIAALAYSALNLGVADFLVRRVAQQPRTLRQDIGVALLIQLTTAGLGALVLVLGLTLIGSPVSDLRLMYVVLVGMVSAPLQGVLLSGLRGHERHGWYAWVSAVSGVVPALGGVLVLFLGADVVTFATVVLVLGIASAVTSWILSGVRPTLPALDFALLREVKEFARGGLPFMSWNLTLAVYGGIDRLLLGFFVPAAENGWYAAAYRIVGITVFIPSVIVAPLFPALSRSVHDPQTLRRTITDTIRVSLLMTVPIAAGIIVLAPVIPSILGWPEDFARAIPLMMILSIHLPIVTVDMVLATVIMALGREGRWVRVGLVASIFNIAVNLVGIPLMQQLTGDGAIGASIVTVLTEILMCIGAIMLIPKHLLDLRLAWDAVRIVLAGAATVAVGLALLGFGIPQAIVGGALAYFVVIVALRAVTLADTRLLLAPLARRAS